MLLKMVSKLICLASKFTWLFFLLQTLRKVYIWKDRSVCYCWKLRVSRLDCGFSAFDLVNIMNILQALASSKVDDKTVPKSHRIDAVFSLFRISFFHGCNIKGMSTAIEKATELIEGGLRDAGLKLGYLLSSVLIGYFIFKRSYFDWFN